MDFRFSQADQNFRLELLAFFQKEMPRVDTEADKIASDLHWDLTLRVRRKLAERGWLTMGWPKKYGGLGVSPLRSLIFNEEMAYHRVPGRDIFGAGMLGPTLMIYGTEEQKKKFLPPVAGGEVQWCQGYSEPEAGSDLASLTTTATEAGDYYVVNGEKIWTSLAHRADWMMLLTRTDPDAPKHRGISFFLVDMKSPGIEIRPIPNMAGDHEFNEVFFHDVRIPMENLVGERNRGWYVAVTLLDFERSGIDYAASCRRLLDDLSKYVAGVAGRRLSNAHRWWVTDQLAQRYIETEVARLIAYKVAWMQGQGMVPTKEASMSKVFGSETYQRVASTGLKILGLYGQLTGGDEWAPLRGRVQSAWQYSFSGTIAAGTSEVQRNIIAGRGLGLPRG